MKVIDKCTKIPISSKYMKIPVNRYPNFTFQH